MHKLDFDFSPNIIKLLGEQLIHDKKIALSELIKNAYDADADTVEILFNTRDGVIDTIIINDDGTGMNIDTIKNVWLKPGVSLKTISPKQPTKHLTIKHKRIPVGEKGVGRLGCHKLGDEIKIITKTKDTDLTPSSVPFLR